MMFNVFLIVLVCAAGVLASTLSRREFIVNGEDAVPGQFPHMASLRNATNHHFCGGFIITNHWIVTASHCVSNRAPETLWVIVGSIYLNSGGVNVFASRIINHPDEFPIETGEAGDISLIQTRDTMIFSDYVRPIGIGAEKIGEGVVSVVAGWGRIGHTDPFANTLQWLTKITITNEHCRSRMPESAVEIVLDNTLCADSAEGTGVCFGDSGSALFVGNTAIGIASWIIAPCGSDYPDAYARVATHRNWILSHIS